ncbi:MAG TPA: hypothetical protein VGP82_00195, partial [Ktedonobacterales bacterium]|nr:hypothetical protein [Ktedonobacterales bacterium]
MHIRPISLDEVDEFSAFGRDPERAATVRSYLEQMLANGSMRTEWCFVAEEGKRLLGTIGLWTIPGLAEPMDFVLLEAPWEDGDLSVGGALLDSTMEQMRHLGAATVGHVLDMPP